MKTLTEFAALTLKNASKTKQDLVAAGKTAEELPAAMGEALKLEGDKLSFLLNALETVEAKLEDLKRVIVFSLAEGEKAPHGSVQKGEHSYSAEYYPPLNPPKGRGPHAGGPGEKGRGGKDGKKGKRGRGGRGRRGEGRGEGRGERSGGGAPGEHGKGEGKPQGRGPRPPRGPKPQQEPKQNAAKPAAPSEKDKS